MAWTELTFAGLQGRLGTDEIAALLNESPAPESKVEEVLSHVAQDVVSRVNTGRRKRGLPPLVGTGVFVPPGAQRHAYTLARRLLTDAFPSLSEFNGDDRRNSVEEAENYLDDLAKNDADSDDPGASSFSYSSNSSFRYGGSRVMDFSTSP